MKSAQEILDYVQLRLQEHLTTQKQIEAGQLTTCDMEYGCLLGGIATLEGLVEFIKEDSKLNCYAEPMVDLKDEVNREVLKRALEGQR